MADNVNIKDAANATVPVGSDEVTIGGVTQQVQRMKLFDGADGSNIPITAFPTGFLRVTDEPRSLLNENYDTLDTTNTFTVTNGGAASVPSVVGGALSLATTTTANSYSRIQSQKQFKIPAPGWKVIAQAIALPDGAAPIANSYRFWGEGVTSGTPTAAAPLTSAIGFEMGTDQKLRAVVYSGGTRTVVQDLSAATGNAKQPTDANYHLYIIYVRTHRVYFYIDGIGNDNLVATGVFTYPDQQTLPVCNMAIAGSTPPASSASFTVLGTSVGDTTKQNVTVGDPDYPWRRAKVTEAGGLNIVGVQSATQTASWTSSTSASTSLTLTVTNLNTVTFGLSSTSTITQGVISFEASFDNTNYFPISAARLDNFGTENSYTLRANETKAWSTSVDGFNYFRIRLSTAITGTGTVSLAMAAQTMPIEPIVNVGDGSVRATYRAAPATASFTPAGTAAVPFFVISGSATRVIRLQRIEMQMTLATAAYITVNAVKYSTAPTGGTASTLTKTPLDSQSPASTANLVQVYTAGPTAGTKVGDISSTRFYAPATATAATMANSIMDYRGTGFGTHTPILRGTAECIGLVFPTAAATAVTAALTVEWTEE